MKISDPFILRFEPVFSRMRAGWLSFLLFWPFASFAQLVPQSISHQGILYDAGGNTIPDANYTLEFNIWSLEIGGDLLWGPLSFDGAAGTGHGPRVPVIGGQFNVQLGPLDTASRNLRDVIQAVSVTGGACFIEVTSPNVGETVQIRRGPRQRLLTAPFAMEAYNGAPPGLIIMWNRNYVPPGWAVCDGTNGTPDLRSRFIKGAIAIGAANYATGGSDSHTHAAAVHSHAHSHYHPIPHAHALSGHSHSADPPNTTTSSYDPPNLVNKTSGGIVNRNIAKTHTHDVDIPSFTTGSSSYTTNTNSGTSNSGDSSIANTSSDGATSSISSHLPPHSTLMFLMKL